MLMSRGMYDELTTLLDVNRFFLCLIMKAWQVDCLIIIVAVDVTFWLWLACRGTRTKIKAECSTTHYRGRHRADCPLDP